MEEHDKLSEEEVVKLKNPSPSAKKNDVHLGVIFLGDKALLGIFSEE